MARIAEPIEKPLDVIRPAAIAAYEEATLTDAERARTIVSALLGDTVEREAVKLVHSDGKARCHVFSDGTTALAAVWKGDGWQVLLVTGAGGDWTTRGAPVASLAELGKALS